jgi:formylglycine-generating enzyme required for sulfatase activity
MVMVCVPAGRFLMGSTDADGEAQDDEKPQHTVTLDAFFIDRTEVTNAQYQRCVDAGVCLVADMNSYDPQGKPNHPVIEITWNDARIYCDWAGARLPTEAEWEKAARGTDGRIYPWGNQAPDCSLANYWGKDGGCTGHTMPVGSYPAGTSPYGLQDMAGNAWEWIADWYEYAYYGASPERNPTGPESGRYRIVRGGSWTQSSPRWYIRAANRATDDPSLRSPGVGFRCVVGEPGG